MRARPINPKFDPRDKITVSKYELKQLVAEEFEKRHIELYKESVADISVQMLANVLVALEQYYGWKKKRLQEFVTALHATEDSMVTPSPLHKTYTTLDNEKHIKDKFGIDLRAEFPADVEIKCARKHKEG